MTLITYKRKTIKLNSMSDPDFGSAPFFIKKEGVYMFGGVHGIDSSEKNLTDKIYYLPVG
jgi:hypothetical protein